MSEKDGHKLITPNVKQCTICGGTVDRFEFHLECRVCKAVGDPFMGMMQPAHHLCL